MTDLPAFATGLLITTLLVAFTSWRRADQRNQLLRTMAAVALNWIVGLIYVQNTGNLTPWHYNIFIDALAAAGVMWHPAGKVQGYIGLFYFFQIAAHIAYGIRDVLGIPTDAIFYYDAITYIAWAQLIALGAWCGGIWIASSVHRPWPRIYARHHRAGILDHRGEK